MGKSGFDEVAQRGSVSCRDSHGIERLTLGCDCSDWTFSSELCRLERTRGY